MKKYVLLFLICIITKTVLVFGQNKINESDIPLPEIIYELPKSLIGEFIMIAPWYEKNITIFPNNKYIIYTDVHSHPYIDWSWGHIVSINGVWYFSELSNRYNPYIKSQENRHRGLQEIKLIDDGFSYSVFRSIRKENIPVPTNLAESISLHRRIAKNQYFEFNNSKIYRVEFNEKYNEIFTNHNNYIFSHTLFIDNGIITIRCGVLFKDFLKTVEPEFIEIYKDYNEDSFFSISTEFVGFIDLLEENENGFKGIIRFTTGVPYYYIEGGTAQIEKINDNIIITMLYKPDIINRNEHIQEGFHSATLILEF